MKYGFGVDLGGTTVKLAFFDENGTMLHKWEIPTRKENDGKHILPDIADAVLGYIKENNIVKGDLLGVGIGVPGAVTADGVVNRCINLGWGVFNIAKTLEDLTGLRVVAGNDATVAAMGECWMGGGRGCQSMVFVTLGTGVGGGLVVNGKAVHGTHGAGCEIGHMLLNKEETEACNCGKKGCVEQYCSATGIVRLAKKHLKATDRASVLRNRKTLTCKDVFDAAGEGDIAAIEITEQFYAYMGEFLANVCCTVDPEMVVLGGGVSKAGAPLLEGVQRYYDHYSYHACRDTKFALATLGNDAGAYGAFRLLLE